MRFNMRKLAIAILAVFLCLSPINWRVFAIETDDYHIYLVDPNDDEILYSTEVMAEGGVSLESLVYYKDGYFTSGWSDDKETLNPVYKWNDTIPAYEGRILYAVWEQEYVVHYYNGTTLLGNRSVGPEYNNANVSIDDFGSSVIIPEGKAFAGWTYENGDPFNGYITGEESLYASFTDVYTVNFVYIDGDEEILIASQSLPFGTVWEDFAYNSFSLGDLINSSEKYFKYWSDSPNGGSLEGYSIEEDRTFYAVLGNVYSVTYRVRDNYEEIIYFRDDDPYGYQQYSLNDYQVYAPYFSDYVPEQGEVFRYWSTTQNGDPYYDPIYGDTVLYAVFTPNYSVTYHYGDYVVQKNIAEGNPPDPYDPAYFDNYFVPDGQAFAYWADENGNPFYDGIWSDIELYAVFSNEYTVTYHLYGDVAVEMRAVEGSYPLWYDEYNFASAVIPEGQGFDHWADENGEYFSGPIYRDIHLYACFINLYQVTYHFYNGETRVVSMTENSAPLDYYAGDFMDCNTVPEGQQFLYWADENNNQFTGSINQNIDLYPVFGVLPTVIFHITNEITETKTYNSNYEDFYSVTNYESWNFANYYVPDGYYFAYWADENGNEVPATLYDGLELYATYKMYISVTYHFYDGSTETRYVREGEGPLWYDASNFANYYVPEGKEFSGWVDSNGSAYNDSIYGDIDLYASFRTSYSVTYHDCYGNVLDSRSVSETSWNINVWELDTSWMDNKKFLYWSRVINGPEFDGAFDSDSIDLYAVAIDQIHNITFDPNGGNLDGNNVLQTYDCYYYCCDYWTINTPYREGYTFVGWSVYSDRFEAMSMCQDILMSDATVYAYWIPAGTCQVEVEYYGTMENPQVRVEGLGSRQAYDNADFRIVIEDEMHYIEEVYLTRSDGGQLYFDREKTLDKSFSVYLDEGLFILKVYLGKGENTEVKFITDVDNPDDSFVMVTTDRFGKIRPEDVPTLTKDGYYFRGWTMPNHDFGYRYIDLETAAFQNGDVVYPSWDEAGVDTEVSVTFFGYELIDNNGVKELSCIQYTPDNISFSYDESALSGDWCNISMTLNDLSAGIKYVVYAEGDVSDDYDISFTGLPSDSYKLFSNETIEGSVRLTSRNLHIEVYVFDKLFIRMERCNNSFISGYDENTWLEFKTGSRVELLFTVAESYGFSKDKPFANSEDKYGRVTFEEEGFNSSDGTFNYDYFEINRDSISWNAGCGTFTFTPYIGYAGEGTDIETELNSYLTVMYGRHGLMFYNESNDYVNYVINLESINTSPGYMQNTFNMYGNDSAYVTFNEDESGAGYVWTNTYFGRINEGYYNSNSTGFGNLSSIEVNVGPREYIAITLEGWTDGEFRNYTVKDSSGNTVCEGSISNYDSQMHLVYVEGQGYSVTYNLYRDTDGQWISETKPIRSDWNIEYSADNFDNYSASNTRIFLHWSEYEDGSPYYGNAFDGLVLYAVYEQLYEVNYYDGDDLLKTLAVRTNEWNRTPSEILGYTYEKQGYRFVGWASNKLSRYPDFHDGLVRDGANLYAVFNKVFHIDYYINGVKVHERDDATANDFDYNPDSSLFEEGYRLAYWADVNGNRIREITDDTELYAVIAKQNPVVTLNPNGGMLLSSNTVTLDGFYTALDYLDYEKVPERTGYGFGGWSTSPREYVSHTGYVMDDIELYAYWVPEGYSDIRVEFGFRNDSDGFTYSLIGDGLSRIGEEATLSFEITDDSFYITAVEPSRREGNIFDITVSNDYPCINQEISLTVKDMVVHYITIYIDKGCNTVHFLNEDGTVYESVVTDRYNKLNFIPEMSKDGYYLAGWYNSNGHLVTDFSNYVVWEGESFSPLFRQAGITSNISYEFRDIDNMEYFPNDITVNAPASAVSGEFAEIIINVGDVYCGLDLYVFDENGNEVSCQKTGDLKYDFSSELGAVLHHNETLTTGVQIPDLENITIRIQVTDSLIVNMEIPTGNPEFLDSSYTIRVKAGDYVSIAPKVVSGYVFDRNNPLSIWGSPGACLDGNMFDRRTGKVNVECLEFQDDNTIRWKAGAGRIYVDPKLIYVGTGSNYENSVSSLVRVDGNDPYKGPGLLFVNPTSTTMTYTINFGTESWDEYNGYTWSGTNGSVKYYQSSGKIDGFTVSDSYSGNEYLTTLVVQVNAGEYVSFAFEVDEYTPIIYEVNEPWGRFDQGTIRQSDTAKHLIYTGIYEVRSVSFAEDHYDVQKNRNFSLGNSVNILPSAATDRTLYWSSSDESVATVDKNGYVVACGIGTAVITATASNGVSDSCTVTVTENTSEDVYITFMPNGDDVTLVENMIAVSKGTYTRDASYYEIGDPNPFRHYPEREGYVFCGWTLDPNDENIILAKEGDSITVDGDMTVYAYWVEEGRTIVRLDDGGFYDKTVPYTFTGGEFTAVDSITVNLKIEDNVSFIDYTRVYDYMNTDIFTRYSDWPTDDLSATLNPVGGIIYMRPEVKKGCYDVTFEFYDGHTETLTTDRYGRLVERPVDSRDDGYFFVGWSKSDGSIMDKWNYEEIRGDLTLYPVWGEKGKECNLTINITGECKDCFTITGLEGCKSGDEVVIRTDLGETDYMYLSAYVENSDQYIRGITDEKFDRMYNNEVIEIRLIVPDAESATVNVYASNTLIVTLSNPCSDVLTMQGEYVFTVGERAVITFETAEGYQLSKTQQFLSGMPQGGGGYVALYGDFMSDRCTVNEDIVDTSVTNQLSWIAGIGEIHRWPNIVYVGKNTEHEIELAEHLTVTEDNYSAPGIVVYNSSDKPANYSINIGTEIEGGNRGKMAARKANLRAVSSLGGIKNVYVLVTRGTIGDEANATREPAVFVQDLSQLSVSVGAGEFVTYSILNSNNERYNEYKFNITDPGDEIIEKGYVNDCDLVKHLVYNETEQIPEGKAMITFDENGGEPLAVNTLIVDLNSIVSESQLKTFVPKKTGYTFIGWSKTKDYNDTRTYIECSDRNPVYYAMWIESGKSLVYYEQDGLPNDVTVEIVGGEEHQAGDLVTVRVNVNDPNMYCYDLSAESTTGDNCNYDFNNPERVNIEWQFTVQEGVYKLRFDFRQGFSVVHFQNDYENPTEFKDVVTDRTNHIDKTEIPVFEREGYVQDGWLENGSLANDSTFDYPILEERTFAANWVQTGLPTNIEFEFVRYNFESHELEVYEPEGITLNVTGQNESGEFYSGDVVTVEILGDNLHSFNVVLDILDENREHLRYSEINNDPYAALHEVDKLQLSFTAQPYLKNIVQINMENRMFIELLKQKEGLITLKEFYNTDYEVDKRVYYKAGDMVTVEFDIPDGYLLNPEYPFLNSKGGGVPFYYGSPFILVDGRYVIDHNKVNTDVKNQFSFRAGHGYFDLYPNVIFVGYGTAEEEKYSDFVTVSEENDPGIVFVNESDEAKEYELTFGEVGYEQPSLNNRNTYMKSRSAVTAEEGNGEGLGAAMIHITKGVIGGQTYEPETISINELSSIKVTVDSGEYLNYTLLDANGHVLEEYRYEATETGSDETELGYVSDRDTSKHLVYEEKEETRAPATLRLVSVNLKDILGMNFYVSVPEEYEGAYALLEYTKAGAEPRKVELTSDIYEADKDRYKVTFPNIPAKEMMEYVSISLYDKDDMIIPFVNSKGVELEGDKFSYRVYDYAMLIAKNSDATYAGLGQAILNYGESVQKLLKYRIDEPMPNGEGYLAEEMLNVTANTAYNMKAPSNYKESSYQSVSVNFEGATAVFVYFTEEVSASSAEPNVLSNEHIRVNSLADGRYRVEITGITAKWQHRLYKIDIEHNGEIYQFEFGVLGYANVMLKNSDPDYVNIGRALYLYNEAARAYFGN